MIDIFIAALLLVFGSGQDRSPFDGRWRTDLSSIEFSREPETSLLLEGVYECTSCRPPYRVPADGCLHPVSGDPGTDARQVRIVHPRRVDLIERKNGRIVRVRRILVSRDGTSRTIEWLDRTSPKAPRLAGKLIQKRSGRAPVAGHAISGSWLTIRAADVTPAAMTETLRLENGYLSMSRATGESYRAKIDGPPSPYLGNPAITEVIVTQAGPRHLVETTLFQGKILSVMDRRISADGKTQSLRARNMTTGAIGSARSNKL